jgi:hypothetical protein
MGFVTDFPAGPIAGFVKMFGESFGDIFGEIAIECPPAMSPLAQRRAL